MLGPIEIPRRGDLHHLIMVVNFDEIVQNSFVVGTVLIVKLLNEIEDVFHFRHVASRPNPQLAAWALKALGLNVFNLVYREVALLSPLELLVEEVQHRKVEGPDVVSARQVNIVVGVEGGEGDGSAEIGFAAAGQRLLGDLVEMALG